ncbi:MAG: hypothetical protein ACOH2V_00485 [Candidatus Saccharimonadaceae bacterium]
MNYKLSKEEVKEIYELVLKSLYRDMDNKYLYGEGGFCNRINSILKVKGILFINPYKEEQFKEHFPELYLHKPSKTYGPYWFRIEEHEVRVQIINKVLINFK